MFLKEQYYFCDFYRPFRENRAPAQRQASEEEEDNSEEEHA